jgi:sarcosine oxidase gamma subunit
VTSTTQTKTDEGAVATTGAVSTFALMPQTSVNLTPHVGRQVRIAAVMVDPDHRDADVTIEEKTTIDPDKGGDTTTRSKTTIEVERGAPDQYTVVSVTPLGASCAP